MSPHAATGTSSLGLCLLVAALAACGTPPPDPSSAAATGSPGPSPPLGPTAVPGQGPPEAVLTGLDVGPVPGDLGTFAWDGFVSDSPWVLGPAAGSTGAGSRLRVELQPGGDPTAWQASWARVVDEQAAEPSDVSALRGGPVALLAPAMPGPWSLQLFARLGAGREAAWYWQVEVLP